MMLAFSVLFNSVKAPGLGLAARYMFTMAIGRLLRAMTFVSTILPSLRPWCASTKFRTPHHPHPWAQEYYMPYASDSNALRQLMNTDTHSGSFIPCLTEVDVYCLIIFPCFDCTFWFVLKQLLMIILLNTARTGAAWASWLTFWGQLCMMDLHGINCSRKLKVVAMTYFTVATCSSLSWLQWHGRYGFSFPVIHFKRFIHKLLLLKWLFSTLPWDIPPRDWARYYYYASVFVYSFHLIQKRKRFSIF